jgi:hypothetical protein
MSLAKFIVAIISLATIWIIAIIGCFRFFQDNIGYPWLLLLILLTGTLVITDKDKKYCIIQNDFVRNFISHAAVILGLFYFFYA